ncbi:hypothetical protein [uncultured Sphingomonas sp.]|uniref:hypothetical protein n=1 Tax=uncultured Sphingomonas sp. TaxID=158754 RepID=UPI0025E4E9DD|nr:hypothetical protein [uncultured Sphingomonas sp.]
MAFNVQIVYGKDVASSSVKATGEDIRPLTKDLYPIFGLTDDLLKKAVEAYLGKLPDAVYVADPTPDNWYATNSWEAIVIRLKPVKAEIVSIDTAISQLKSQVFKNNSSKTASFDVSITDDVSDTVDSNWSETKSFGVSQSVNYGTSFIGGDTSITFQADFQVGGSKSRTVSMGQSSGVMVDLAPGESVTANLIASKGTMKVRVVFEAYLTGVIAAYYKGVFKWKHVWPVDIAGALEALNGSHTLRVTNEIAIDYFSSGEIVLEDTLGKRIRLRAPMLLTAD